MPPAKARLRTSAPRPARGRPARNTPARNTPARTGAKNVSALPRQLRARRTRRARAVLVAAPRRSPPAIKAEARFAEVLALIEAARRRAYQSVNAEMTRALG